MSIRCFLFGHTEPYRKTQHVGWIASSGPEWGGYMITDYHCGRCGKYSHSLNRELAEMELKTFGYGPQEKEGGK